MSEHNAAVALEAEGIPVPQEINIEAEVEAAPMNWERISHLVDLGVIDGSEKPSILQHYKSMLDHYAALTKRFTDSGLTENSELGERFTKVDQKMTALDDYLVDLDTLKNVKVDTPVDAVEFRGFFVGATIALISFEDELKSYDNYLTGMTTPAPTPPVVNPKEAAGSKKAPVWSVFPRWVSLLVGRVMSTGAAKYGRFNYRDSSIAASTYEDAMERHAQLWFDGEDNDEESGVSHLAHVIACATLLLDAQATGKLHDDRQKTGIVTRTLKELEEVRARLPLPVRQN